LIVAVYALKEPPKSDVICNVQKKKKMAFQKCPILSENVQISH
jgi:hypothetical protein